MITAIIPVRKGSRRLKNKNISPFSLSNLLGHKILQLKQVHDIDTIVVSSDCDLMLSMAKNLGVETHKRPDEYCDESSKSFGEVVSFICSNVPGDDIVWATCTSPLVEPSDYQNAINVYKNLPINEYDSIMSVEVIKRYLWSETGPLNYKLGINHVPSQDLPNLYRVTDGILIAPRNKMIEWNYFHGPNPFKFELSKRSSIDIDDLLDLECAKAWLPLSLA